MGQKRQRDGLSFSEQHAQQREWYLGAVDELLEKMGQSTGRRSKKAAGALQAIQQRVQRLRMLLIDADKCRHDGGLDAIAAALSKLPDLERAIRRRKVSANYGRKASPIATEEDYLIDQLRRTSTLILVLQRQATLEAVTGHSELMGLVRSARCCKLKRSECSRLDEVERMLFRN